MQHSNLAKYGWDRLTLIEQLGNIGSEVGRAIKSKTEDSRLKATYRALELFDLTLSSKSIKTKSERREVARAREVTCDFLLCDNVYSSTAQSLDSYFMHFAFASRLGL